MGKNKQCKKKREDNEIYYDKSINLDNACRLAPVAFPHTRELCKIVWAWAWTYAYVEW